ncbi:MarR family winged helix-turn-helix transcriptional regulator [Streptomyces sp. NPDC087894]|uniref:MarR family winged helix-turn-helix transcriptional regulator n=1 Tax=Streptomyces sp. NPDC087894 TaxID=3365816 RepID=UPI003819EDB0
MPLSSDEERLWRALMRAMVALPKMLDDDLLTATGLTLSEYSVLMHLSEAGHGNMRMTDLAAATALSLSRISRVVSALQARGWVVKQRHSRDARCSVAILTVEGLQRLESAYPLLLASARRRVVDRVDSEAIAAAADHFEEIASALP